MAYVFNYLLLYYYYTISILCNPRDLLGFFKIQLVRLSLISISRKNWQFHQHGRVRQSSPNVGRFLKKIFPIIPIYNLPWNWVNMIINLVKIAQCVWGPAARGNTFYEEGRRTVVLNCQCRFCLNICETQAHRISSFYVRQDSQQLC